MINMNCPKCKKAKLIENISIKGQFRRKKIFTFFCPLCDFEKEKEVSYSLSDCLMEVGEDLKRIGKKIKTT